MKKLVIGYFGNKTGKLDGQTIKTQQLYNLIRNDVDERVSFFDTEVLKFNKFQIFKMFYMCMRCDKLIYLPAHGNLKFIFPFIFLCSIIFNFKIFYFVVGGWLDIFIKNKILHKFLLKKIEKILVETNFLRDELISMGFNNVDLFPNFRFNPKKNCIVINEKTKFVFLSRVQKAKGIDFILKFASDFSHKKNFSIDIYGPLENSYKEEFFKSVSEFDNIKYLGEVSPIAIQDILLQYDVMLLPTHYYTEGLPGALIDAMQSNLPIIISRWKYADEFVFNYHNGLTFNFNDYPDFVNKVNCVVGNQSLIYSMKKNILDFKYLYSYENALGKFKSLMLK